MTDLVFTVLCSRTGGHGMSFQKGFKVNAISGFPLRHEGFYGRIFENGSDG